MYAIPLRVGLCCVAFWGALGVAGPALAKALQANAQNYLVALAQLQPGDTLALAAGTYRSGLPLHGLQGEAGRPIIIEGEASGRGTVFLGRLGTNTVSIKDSAYIVVRSLSLDGAGLPVDAVKAEGSAKFAHHITLERLTIVNHGSDQQIVGISTKCPAWSWVIRDNVIRGAGTGIYLGNSDGGAPFIGGIVEHNLIVDTIGYNLQIKHQLVRPEGIGMPLETMQTVIRHNVFSKAKGGASGHMARPNVLLGHFPASGSGANDSYSVYGNFFYENPDEALLQAEGDVSIHENIFFNSRGDALHLMRHKSAPRRIDVAHNTVLAQGVGIRVTGGDSRYSQTVRANAVFAAQPLVGGEQHDNITAPYANAGQYLLAPFASLGKLDVSPRAETLRYSPAPSPDRAPISETDFFGRRFSEPTAGALVSGQTAPWLFDLAIQPIKPCLSSQECAQ